MNGDPVELWAELPHPVGINRAYRVGQSRLYKSREAVGWQQSAILHLRRFGFRRQPAGVYWVEMRFVLHTVQLDADAPLKSAIDAVSFALGVDDRFVGMVSMRKELVRERGLQRLEVQTSLWSLADRDEWERWSKRGGVGGPT